MNNYFLLDFHEIHSSNCPYVNTEKEGPKKRGRPSLPRHIKELRKEEHKEYMREYQRKQREALTEEEKEELNIKAKEHYHKHKEDIKIKKKEINALSRDATYVLRDLYLMGNIIPMNQTQKIVLDKFFNLPFKNI
jgi:hypothetical protein